MDIALERLSIEKSAEKKHLLTKISQRTEHLAKLHVLPLPFSPPFFAMKAVSGKKHCQAHWSFARRCSRAQLVAPYVERFQPRQRHRDADAPKKCAPGEGMCIHKRLKAIRFADIVVTNVI